MNHKNAYTGCLVWIVLVFLVFIMVGMVISLFDSLLG